LVNILPSDIIYKAQSYMQVYLFIFTYRETKGPSW